MLKKAARFLLFIASAVLLCMAISFVYLMAFAYCPKKSEPISADALGKEVFSGEHISVLSFNTGFGSLPADAVNYRDGGDGFRQKDSEKVIKNVASISQILAISKADAIFLQEVDTDSRQSFYFNEKQYYELATDYESAFAFDRKSKMQVVPIGAHGKINSGNLTLCKNALGECSRLSLGKMSFSDRLGAQSPCALVCRLPIKDSEKQIVLINLKSCGKDLENLSELMKKERESGNYIIAAGDFNKTQESEFKAFESFGFSVLSEQGVFTRRSLNLPYDENFVGQKTVCDFFIVSDNVEPKTVRTVDQQFRFSHHNPIFGVFELKK